MKTVDRARARVLLRQPVHLLSLGLGSGLSPWAPGTAGSLLGVALYLLLRPLPLPVYMLLTTTAIAVGIWACGRTARALGVHDAGVIVWDEVAGVLVAMTLAPADWRWTVGGFLLFRFFDIVKPWPIRLIDRRVHGGAGIMLDDVLAGIYTLLALLGLSAAGVFT